MIDCHVHTHKNINRSPELHKRLSAIGMSGAFILSLPPENFYDYSPITNPTERLSLLKDWCLGRSSFYPFFWLDPTADDAIAQVEMCCHKDIMGFKVICDHFYPSNIKAMEVFKLIAKKNKPILFHSGILWDAKVSSKYNRPVEFECLLEIHHLRFAMAHISWPWCDELLAVYGKFQRQKNCSPEIAPEMFIDTTPGTPPIYREAELSKLYMIGYELEDNLMFGTDGTADDYCSEWAGKLFHRDKTILKRIALDEEKIAKYFGKNAERFIEGRQ